MTFENIVVAISALLYFSVGVGYALKGQYAWALVWFCYSGANVGLVIVRK